MSREDIDGLYEALKHGDLDHRMWLHDAIEAYFDKKPIPPVKGSGNKEAMIADLQAEVFRLKAKHES